MQPATADTAPPIYRFDRLIDPFNRSARIPANTLVRPRQNRVAVWAFKPDGGPEEEIGALIDVFEDPAGPRVKCSIQNAEPGTVYAIWQGETRKAVGWAPNSNVGLACMTRNPRFLAYAPVHFPLEEPVFDPSRYTIGVLVNASALPLVTFLHAKLCRLGGGGEVFAFKHHLRHGIMGLVRLGTILLTIFLRSGMRLLPSERCRLPGLGDEDCAECPYPGYLEVRCDALQTLGTFLDPRFGSRFYRLLSAQWHRGTGPRMGRSPWVWHCGHRRDSYKPN
jgi:hypothetical protein